MNLYELKKYVLFLNSNTGTRINLYYCYFTAIVGIKCIACMGCKWSASSYNKYNVDRYL